MDHQEDILMVPSMDYNREHIKIYVYPIIIVTHVLYLIFEEKFTDFNFEKIRPIGGPSGGRCDPLLIFIMDYIKIILH